MKNTFFSPYLFLLLVTQPFLQANTIGYIEDFALAPDREAVLKDLIPGTREYYYYHALHAQNEGRHGEVEKLIGLWVKRYGETSRFVKSAIVLPCLNTRRTPRNQWIT